MKLNDKLISDYLVYRKAFPQSPGVHRDSIVVALDIPRTTVYDALVRLELKNIVQRFVKPRRKGRTGRPIVLWILTTEEF